MGEGEEPHPPSRGFQGLCDFWTRILCDFQEVVSVCGLASGWRAVSRCSFHEARPSPGCLGQAGDFGSEGAHRGGGRETRDSGARGKPRTTWGRQPSPGLWTEGDEARARGHSREHDFSWRQENLSHS